ncbi:MAG: amidohydrolase family protein [Candidatus Binatus sp.]
MKTVPGTPRSHAFVERLIGTIRREFLDRTLFWGQGDLELKLEAYQAYYVGFPPTADGAPYKAAEPTLQLARFPNFYLKFSTENLCAAVKGKSTAKDFFRCLLDRFGAKRMMWGSNFPATFDRGLKEQLELALNELSFVSEEDRRWLFSETALTLWPMLR